MGLLNCPSCKANSILIDKIKVKDLVKLYKKKYQIDINNQFKGIETINYLECKECGLRYFDPIVSGDDTFYKSLQEEDWYYLHDDKTEYNFAKQLISNNDKVLDVGSGRGVFRQYIDSEYYQGLDFSTKAIELAKEDGINVLPTPIQDHADEHISFYDVVVLFQLIEHISDVEGFIKASVKCLKPGGKIIIATPDNDGFIKSAVNCALNLPPHHILHWNEKSLSSLANRFNLEVETVYREPVVHVHQSWWYTTIINSYIHKLLGLKIHLVNMSFFSWFLHGCSHVLGWGLKLFSIHKKGKGQSIIIVYKKGNA